MQRECSYHLSVDDVFASLIEVADQNMRLFEHPFYAFLQSIHERFHINIDLYLFAEGEVSGRRRTLDELSEQLRAEISDTPWMHFGPHALDFETRPYDQTLNDLIASFEIIYRHIDRLSGESARSHCVRLHYFSECVEAIPYLRSKGVEAIFLTDRPTVSYSLPVAQISLLQKSGSVTIDGMSLMRSFPRIESLAALNTDDYKLATMLRERLNQHGYVALFTHEADLSDSNVRELVSKSLLQLERLGARPQ